MYPVKSMRGERVGNVTLDPEGIRGDRRFAIESSDAPAGKPLLTGRERAAMLLYSPRKVGHEELVRTPGGEWLSLHSSELLQRLSINGSDSERTLSLKRSPERPLTDVRPVSLVSTDTLVGLSREMGRAIDPQRFRSNIVLRLDDGRPSLEDAWNGRTLRFGDEGSFAELLIRERIPRCRMVSLDPDTAEPDNSILKHLARAHQGRLGIYATVQQTGMLREHQPVFLV